jgi:autotransporter translocation and assembly factor TamB
VKNAKAVAVAAVAAANVSLCSSCDEQREFIARKFFTRIHRQPSISNVNASLREAILNKAESIPQFGVLIKQETLAPHAHLSGAWSLTMPGSASVASPQYGLQ